jgi:Protein of unknown function (DUF421).
MEWYRIAGELLISYLALLFLTKALGKTQLSQATPLDFISALILGELVGNGLFEKRIGIGKILFAVGLWGILVSLTEFLTQKSRRLRPLIEGEANVIVEKGKISYEALKKNRLDLDQLQQFLRKKDIFSLRDCEYAILEPDGTLSVMKKSHLEPATKADLGLSATSGSLSYYLIKDGEIIEENLRKCGVGKNQLLEELKKRHIGRVEDVLVAEWTEGMPLFIQLKKEEGK